MYYIYSIVAFPFVFFTHFSFRIIFFTCVLINLYLLSPVALMLSHLLSFIVVLWILKNVIWDHYHMSAFTFMIFLVLLYLLFECMDRGKCDCKAIFRPSGNFIKESILYNFNILK